MTEAAFRRKLLEETISVDSLEDNLTFNIFCLEKELGCHITEDYPLLKMFNQFEEMQKFRKMEEKEYDKIKRRR